MSITFAIQARSDAELDALNSEGAPTLNVHNHGAGILLAAVHNPVATRPPPESATSTVKNLVPTLVYTPPSRRNSSAATVTRHPNAVNESTDIVVVRDANHTPDVTPANAKGDESTPRNGTKDSSDPSPPATNAATNNSANPATSHRTAADTDVVDTADDPEDRANPAPPDTTAATTSAHNPTVAARANNHLADPDPRTDELDMTIDCASTSEISDRADEALTRRRRRDTFTPT